MSATQQMDSATQKAHFRAVAGRRRGYHQGAVDAFLAAARANFEAKSAALTAQDIREASFPLVKGGYVVHEVDTALGRLEEALAIRARNNALVSTGAATWLEQARAEAQTILNRVTREPRDKFARTGVLGYGYRVAEVDHVADRIARYLRDGESLSVEQVRSVAFRMQRGGYREEQVDALLDATVDVILAVR